MNRLDKLAKTLVESQDRTAKTSPYDTTAVVTRVEGDTAWVHIPDGEYETPAVMAISAKKDDTVRVRVVGGKAYLIGNATSPPTDDTRAQKAEAQAQRAQNAANTATEQASIATRSAVIAHDAADRAVADAQVANESAQQAIADAERAQTAADVAQDSLKSVVQGATTVEKAVSVMQTALEAVVDYDPDNDTVQEYFWHDDNGAHVLGDTSGYRNDIASDGMKIMDIATEMSVAEFSSEVARMGNSYDLHVDIERDGMKIISGADEKARFTDEVLSLGDDSGRFEVTPTKTTFYGNNAQEVGYIGQGTSVSGSYTQILAESKLTYSTPYTIYNKPLAFAPESDIAFRANVNGTDTNVTIPYQQDYSGTTNSLQIAYTAQTHNLSVVYNGAKTNIGTSVGYINGKEKEWMYGTALKGAPLKFVFKYTPATGTTITCGGILTDDITFTAGTAQTKTRTEFMSTTVYSFVYDGNKTITVTWKSGSASDEGYVSNVHYYAQGVIVTEVAATYDRTYSAPIFSFGSNSLDDGYAYATLIGEGLKAGGDNQLVIGRYNDNNNYSAFVLGWGTSDQDRQNVFNITQEGNLILYIDNNAASGTTDGDFYNALNALGW